MIKIVNRGVYVRTDAMTRLSRQMDDLTRSYQRAQRKVVDEAVSVALTYVVFERHDRARSARILIISLKYHCNHSLDVTAHSRIMMDILRNTH